jgi:hypothetical protein
MRHYRPVPDAASSKSRMHMQQIFSAATVTAVGLTCKASLHSGLCSISVRSLPYLPDALYSFERRNGQGILTGESSTPTTAKSRS